MPIRPVKTLPLAPVLEDLAIRADSVRSLAEPPGGSPSASPSASHGGPRHALVGVPPDASEVERTAPEILAFAQGVASPDGALLLLLEGPRADLEIARWRNALWPFAHVGGLYRMSQAGIEREALQGRTAIRGASGLHGVMLVAHRREHVLAPDTTVAKFDKTASGWDGDPSSPGYAHHRWMRSFVGTFGLSQGVRRILDFGCGAGWVGIEAALRAGDAELCAFDPSSEMIKLAQANARASAIARFGSRLGFGEDPPYPASGEEPFDLVISSGVLSFSPDPARWLDGLARTVAQGGRVVLGDIHRDARGMRRRRETKTLLPAREMNAWTRAEARAALEERGFVFEAWAGYQLTRPIPELMHFSEKRLAGALHPTLLWLNRRSAARDARRGSPEPDRFDSFVIRMRRE